MAGKTAILSVRIISDANDKGFKKAARDVQAFELKVKKSLAGAIKGMTAMATKAGAAVVGITGLAAPIAAIGTAAYQALAPVAALTAAMAPAALTGAALGIATLKTAFNGLGDALKATDPAAFAAAIADMPPAMQSAATSLRDLKTGFSDLGDSIKQSFWEPLSNLDQLQVLIAPIGDAMNRLAGDMGHAAAGLVDFVSQGTGLAAVEQLLSSGATAMGSLARAAVSTVEGIIAVGAAAAPIFEQLTAKIEQVAAAWRDRMVAGFADGSLQSYFESAVEKGRAFMEVMGQLGGIVGGVFSALSTAGTPMLGTLAQLVEQTNNWVNSAAGMATLQNYFSEMSAAVAALAPVLGQVAQIIIGTVAPAIAGVIQTLAPALGAIVETIGSIVSAIVPILEPLSQIVAMIGETLAGAINAVMPIIQQLASIIQEGLAAALTALQPVMPVIVDAFAQLAAGLQPLMPAIQQLVEAVVGLIPPFVQLVSSVLPPLVAVLSAVVPVVAAVVAGFAQFLQGITPLISIIGSLVGGVLTALAAILRVVASAISPVIEFLVSMGVGIGTVIGLAGKLVGVLGTVGGVLSKLAGFFSGVSNAVSTLIGLVGRLIGALSNIRFPSPPSWLSRFFSEPMGMELPDWENIGFGQFGMGDTIGMLSRIPANANQGMGMGTINVTVNVSGMVTADKVELAETIQDALTTHARVTGRATAVGL